MELYDGSSLALMNASTDLAFIAYLGAAFTIRYKIWFGFSDPTSKNKRRETGDKASEKNIGLIPNVRRELLCLFRRTRLVYILTYFRQHVSGWVVHPLSCLLHSLIV